MDPINDSYINIREFDLIKSCRVCLSNHLNMSHIFNDNNKIIDKIEFCTGIQIKEEKDLPTQICKNCLTDLSIAHKFKATCLLSERSLQKIHLDRVKIEIPNSDVDINNEATSDVEFDYYSIKIDKDEDYCNVESLKLKSELDLRRSKRQNLEEQNHSEIKVKNPKAVRKRGPYTKKGSPRLKKYKFKRLYCETCNIKFTSRQESEEHKRLFHTEGASWICEVCGKAFVHRASLHSHVRSHLPPHYACAHCDYSCNYKYDLVKHLRVHFAIKKYKCSKCNALYHTSSNLRDHERRHHQTVVKRYACEICARPFYDRTKLNRHVDSHNDIKRFKCDVCCTCFSRRCQWKKHLEKQHSIVVPPQRPGRRKTNLVLGDVKIE